MKYKSQRAAYPYFVLAMILFGLQVLFGLVIAAQFIWPQLLRNILPFSVGREVHLNTMVFWLLLGLMGATYYLVPEETQSELYSTKLASLQFWLLGLTGVATVVGFLFGWTEGREYIEAPRLLDWLIVIGALIFLFNVLATILKSRRWTAIMGVLFAGMTGLSLMYLVGMKFFGSISVDQFFWWWVIHFWVEGTWELIAAAITAYLLVKLTGVNTKVVAKWLYIEVTLVVFTGVLGIGHHYYWIGTPKYWLMIGGLFGLLEPIPILLMVIDTLRHTKGMKTAGTNRVALLWLVGAAITHFVGAGLMGVVQTLPSINKWTHGTQLTAAHGHLAFYGAFAMLVIAAMYYMVPEMTGALVSRKSGSRIFWMMLLSMCAMSLIMFGAGITQVYMERIMGLDFTYVKNSFTNFWLLWRLVAGFFFAWGTLWLVKDSLGLFSGSTEYYQTGVTYEDYINKG
ncbi:cbb3-type cytochrome c oxidase subunit I [Metallumcola ferriviriculae]|uniref:Cbb3-type cytochrome c oxidase subunit I n=1 Tax=Metallumcola ferriviriculae TaxID=3039180 RepID=A0AAU0URE8_9FIRM|nr:cbb3-type cytochrome c oxidase subunit I [Desulfitibacteraceae bacterium MK1]